MAAVLRLVLALVLLPAVLAGSPPAFGDEWARLDEEGRALFRDGQHAKAAAALEQAVRQAELASGIDSLPVATSLNSLGVALRHLGRYGDAEKQLARALAIRVRLLGPESSAVANTLSNLGGILVDTGELPRAEVLLQEALAVKERVEGRAHPDVASILEEIAHLNHVAGRYAQARSDLERALAVRDGVQGPYHPQTATTLARLASLERLLGRNAQARQFGFRALEIREKVYGPSHALVAVSLTGVALTLLQQGELVQAEQLAERALVIVESRLGRNHSSAVAPVNVLAEIRRASGRLVAAQPLYERALAISLGNYRPSDPPVASALNNLGVLLVERGEHAQAEPLLRRALMIHESRSGGDRWRLLLSLNNLADVLRGLGRYREAEFLYRRSLAIAEDTLGHSHPTVALVLNNLAFLAAQQGRLDEAVRFARRAHAALHISAQSMAIAGDAFPGIGLLRSRRDHLAYNLSILDAASGPTTPERIAVAREGFEVSQLAKASETSATVEQVTARLAGANTELGGLLRSRQDEVMRRRALEKDLIGVLGGTDTPDAADALAVADTARGARRVDRIREEIEAIDRRLRRTDSELASQFPDFGTLVSTAPLAVASVQRLLRPGEAMLSFLVSRDWTFLWTIRPSRFAYVKLDIGRSELEQIVGRLRKALDPASGWTREYPATEAHALFKRLLGPVMEELEGVTTLIVVPDGPLQSLPLSVLVTDVPADRAAGPYARDVAWLVRRFALATLPSENSLQALRRVEGRNAAAEPFVGFGDPLLGGGPPAEQRRVGALYTARGVADVRELARLERLPESADEIIAMAKSLGASPETIFLRERATESRVKSMDLRRFRTVAFATHALVTGEFTGVVEPALVLSPPPVGSELDDGLLTASEVAQLQLNANLVILSACSTAAPDGAPGAEGLSGLAKAFFHAGSRALLVSHWPVESESAARLTTEMIRELAATAAISEAEALRRASLALMSDRATSHYAHPAFWAPFVVVGAPRSR